MFDRVNQQAFGDTVCHFPHGPVGLGAAAFFPHPGSPLHPEVLCANLITMAAAAAGNWLAGVIPTVFNAVRTPEFEGFPSLLQAALSPHYTKNDAPEMIGFANLLNEQDATDVFIGGQERSHKLLAQLQVPGQSLEWSGQSPGEPPVTVRFQRTGEMTDDGSWVMRTDLYHGHELKSSRSTRVHTVSDDARQPEEFRDDVSHGFQSCLGRMAQGEDPRIAVVCEDGATLSGAMAATMQQMHREFQRSTHDGVHAVSSPQADQRSSREYQETCRQTLGQGFAKGMEPFLHVGARQPSRPPEAMLRMPFVSTQRATAAVVELDKESDEDTAYESDLSSDTASIAGSDPGGSTWSLSDSVFNEDLPSNVQGPKESTTQTPVNAEPEARRDRPVDRRPSVEVGTQTETGRSADGDTPKAPPRPKRDERRAGASDLAARRSMTDAPSQPVAPQQAQANAPRPEVAAAPPPPAPPVAVARPDTLRRTTSLPNLPDVPLHIPGRFDAKPEGGLPRAASAPSLGPNNARAERERRQLENLRREAELNRTLSKARTEAESQRQLDIAMQTAKKGVDRLMEGLGLSPRAGLNGQLARGLTSDARLLELIAAMAPSMERMRAAHRQINGLSDKGVLSRDILRQQVADAVAGLPATRRDALAQMVARPDGAFSKALSHAEGLVDLGRSFDPADPADREERRKLLNEANLIEAVLSGVRRGLAPVRETKV